MGWNDHVEFIETKCLMCGEIDNWEYWDDTAIARYSGGLDKKLGHDANNHNTCPHCGWHEGEVVDDDYCL